MIAARRRRFAAKPGGGDPASNTGVISTVQTVAMTGEEGSGFAIATIHDVTAAPGSSKPAIRIAENRMSKMPLRVAASPK